MPLNSTTFLTTQGWEGAGVPLDGKGGKGLKKPLAIPQKRGLKGLGKERDRAVEWWDCLFETSAKTLNIALPSSSKLPTSADGLLQALPASSSNLPSASNDTLRPNSTITLLPAAATPITNVSSSSSSTSRISMQSAAKREYARRVLMSSFVRGRPEVHPKPKSLVEEAKIASPSSEAIVASPARGVEDQKISSTVDECGRPIVPSGDRSTDSDKKGGKGNGRISSLERGEEKKEEGRKSSSKDKKKSSSERKARRSSLERHQADSREEDRMEKKKKKEKRRREDKSSGRERMDGGSASKEVDGPKTSSKRKRPSKELEAPKLNRKKAKRELAKVPLDANVTTSLPVDDSQKLSKEQRKAEKAKKKAKKEARAIKKARRAAEEAAS